MVHSITSGFQQPRRFALIMLLAGSFLASVVVADNHEHSGGHEEEKEDPVKEFVKGAYNKVNLGKDWETNVGSLIEFGMEEAGLGPFAGLLVGALGLEREEKIPEWVGKLEEKLENIQEAIETVAGGLRFDRQEELKKQMRKFSTDAGRVVHLYRLITNPDLEGVYHGFRTENPNWTEGEQLQKQLTATFQSSQKLSENAVSVVYQSIQRYDMKYVNVGSLKQTITHNLMNLTNSIDEGDNVASMQTWRENFEGLVNYLGRMTCSQCGGPGDFITSPGEVLQYREALNQIYGLYNTVLAVKKQAAIMWLLMHHDYSEQVGKAGTFFQNITLANVQQAFAEESANAYDSYQRNFKQIGRGYLGANRVTYCNLMGSDTAPAPRRNTTIGAGNTWEMSIPETMIGYDGDVARSGMDAEFFFDTPGHPMPTLAPGKCVTFGGLPTMEHDKTYSIGHRDRYVTSGDYIDDIVDRNSGDRQDVMFKVTDPNWREVVVALTDCKLVRANSRALDYGAGPGMECVGKNYGGDFGELEWNRPGLGSRDATSWMYKSFNGQPSVADQIHDITGDEAHSQTFVKARFVTGPADGASDPSSQLAKVACFIDPDTASLSIANC